MLGLMQDRPLLISQIIDFAGRYYPDVEIVTRTVEGPIHRYGYKDAAEARQAAGRGAAGAGHQARRPGRHHRLEHLSPLRALFRHLRHRRRAAHASTRGWRPSTSPTSPTTPRTRRSSSTSTCCRSSRACGRMLKTVKHVVVMTDRAHMPASSKIPNLLCYEELIADKPGTLDVARLRRAHGVVALLHLGHDRQPQGRALLAPLDGHPFDDDVLGRGDRAQSRHHHPAGGADVPRQRLGPGLCRADVRRQAGLPRPQARRRQRLRASGQGAGHPERRRADGVAGPARLLRPEQAQDVVGQAHPDRRLGRAARHDRALLEGARRRGRPGLGHDRDEPARHDDPLQQGRARAARRRALRHHRQAGPAGVRLRDEDRRRCRQRPAAGRQRLGQHGGARPVDREGLHEGRRQEPVRRGRLVP